MGQQNNKVMQDPTIKPGRDDAVIYNNPVKFICLGSRKFVKCLLLEDGTSIYPPVEVQLLEWNDTSLFPDYIFLEPCYYINRRYIKVVKHDVNLLGKEAFYAKDKEQWIKLVNSISTNSE